MLEKLEGLKGSRRIEEKTSFDFAGLATVDFGRQGFGLVQAASEPYRYYYFLKRCFDVALACLLIFAATPILLVSLAAIFLTTGRPLFFGQRRLGLKGKEFTCWKLRTMVKDAESMRDDVLHLNTMDGPIFKNPEDPRVTRVGRLLRRASIDELPQLWNVLRGEMSIVGPRPFAVTESKYRWDQAKRLSVKPGLTCIWQVSGRSTITFDRAMAMDIEYISVRSLRFDLLLVLLTVSAVVTRKGAS